MVSSWGAQKALQKIRNNMFTFNLNFGWNKNPKTFRTILPYGWPDDYLSYTLAEIIMRITVRFYFGHVRTYSWLHKLRNTQGKIYRTDLGNKYGIYEECTRKIHKYLWYIIWSQQKLLDFKNWFCCQKNVYDIPFIFLIYIS